MSRAFLSRWAAISWAALLVPAALASEGDAPTGGEPGISIEAVRVGCGGVLKVGKWSPVAVEVATTRPLMAQLIVHAPDPDGNLAALPHPPVSLAEPGRHTLHALFKTGRLEGSLHIDVVENGKPLASRRATLSADDVPDQPVVVRQSVFLLATVGHPAGFQPEEPVRVVELDSPDDLPNHVDGYDGLDALVIAGRYDLDEDRNQALREWVRLGGHLMLSVGSEIAAYRDSPLAQWVPVTVSDTPVWLANLSGLESYSASNTRIEFSGRIKAARLRLAEGQEFVKGLYGSLVVRAPYGLGRVTVCGLDLDRPPLSHWEPLARVNRKILLGDEGSREDRATSRREQLESSGITDLASQLNAAQENFPTVRRFSRWSVMSLMLLYIVLIGPLDYLLVHRVLKKPHWTWVTFPLIVVAAVGASAWGAARANGDKLRVNQVDIVDIDAATNAVRGRSWVTIYSPESHRYRVEVHPVDLGFESAGHRDGNPASPRVSWSSIPENAFSGMYRPAGFEIARPSYAFAENAKGVANLPISIWSTKGLAAQWSGSASAPLVESTLESTGYGHLSGSLKHRLPAEIKGWILAYGRSVFVPAAGGSNQPEPVLRPHQSWPQNWSTVTQRLLEGLLTGVTSAMDTARGEGVRIEKARYDQLSLDTGEIVRMITFHREAGGPEYTGLENNTLRGLEFSYLLDMNRAVLLGRLDAPAATVSINGEVVEPDRRATYVRIVLPVKKTGDIPRQLPKYEEEQASRQ